LTASQGIKQEPCRSSGFPCLFGNYLAKNGFQWLLAQISLSFAPELGGWLACRGQPGYRSVAYPSEALFFLDSLLKN
jgi:hypothetical protein